MIVISEEIKNTFSKREKLMYRALEIIAKMLRKNPMGDLSLYPPDLISLLPGGEKRDPKGEEYISYFLSCAALEIKKEEESE